MKKNNNIKSRIFKDKLGIRGVLILKRRLKFFFGCSANLDQFLLPEERQQWKKPYPYARKETTAHGLSFNEFTLCHDTNCRIKFYAFETIYGNVLKEYVIKFGHRELVASVLAHPGIPIFRDTGVCNKIN